MRVSAILGLCVLVLFAAGIEGKRGKARKSSSPSLDRQAARADRRGGDPQARIDTVLANTARFISRALGQDAQEAASFSDALTVCVADALVPQNLQAVATTQGTLQGTTQAAAASGTTQAAAASGTTQAAAASGTTQAAAASGTTQAAASGTTAPLLAVSTPALNTGTTTV